jgi:DNA sulfur modification protein DndC
MLMASTMAPIVRIEAAPAEATSLWDKVVASVRTEYLSEIQDYPWIIGFSGGKDSTVVAQAVFAVRAD